MNYSFHPEAENEFIKTIDYFENQQRELGQDFSIEVYNTIQRIRINPRSWTKVSANIRRALLKRFPYGILYHYDHVQDNIFIVAVMHLSREPGYWKNRVG